MNPYSLNSSVSSRKTPLGPVLLRGSYTYAHFLDDVSDVFGFDSTPSAFQSVSQVLGASPAYRLRLFGL